MRACACDTASRLCVRTVVCWSAFSLVPPLGSTCSSAARAASFAGFTATMGESDFSGPFIVGFGLRPSRRGPCKTPQGRPRDIPVPEQEASAHASVYDDAGPTYVSRSRHRPYRLLQDGKHRRPEVGFRRSMAGLRYPLSTLRFAPRGSPRMTRGRCGSLHLHRRGLSPHASCRSPGAPVHLISNGSDMTRSRRRLRTPASCAKKSSRVVFERRSSRLGGRSNRLWSSFEAASERRRSDACRPLHYDELGSFMTLRARLIVGP